MVYYNDNNEYGHMFDAQLYNNVQSYQQKKKIAHRHDDHESAGVLSLRSELDGSCLGSSHVGDGSSEEQDVRLRGVYHVMDPALRLLHP